MTAPRQKTPYFIIALLLLPLAFINLVAFIIPVIRIVVMSFIESRPGGVLTENYTLDNYLVFFGSKFNLELISNTISLSFFVTLVTLVSSYPIAYFLYRVSPRWKNILFVITISPLLVSGVVRTYGWMVLLGDQGLVNGLLMMSGLIGAPIRLINNQTGVFIGMVEILMPYMTLALIAGFGRLNVSFEEAAASLGAGRITRFRRIILPLTMPGILLGCLLCFVLCVSAFITPKLLGGGRVFLLATEIYDYAVVQLEWTAAAATSVVVLLIFGLALMIYSQFVRRFD